MKHLYSLIVGLGYLDLAFPIIFMRQNQRFFKNITFWALKVMAKIYIMTYFHKKMKSHRKVKVLKRDWYFHLFLPLPPCVCTYDLRRNGREVFQRVKPNSPEK